jgi:HEAT repeat protein
MGQAALAGAGGARRKGQLRVGMKGLMVVVASCAFIIWGGVSIRDYVQGNNPLRVIRSGNAIERQMAAQDLSGQQRGIGAEEAVAALINTLSDDDAGVRAAAAQSLAALVYQLNHPPAAPVASDLLERRIDVAIRGLVPLLSDRDTSVRSAAATSLGMMAGRPSPGRPAPDQLAALRDGSNAVRRQAARMIHGSSDMTLPPELVSALQDESAEVRAAAARALARFGMDLDPVIPALLAMLERDETTVQKACAEALEAAWPTTPALVPTLMEFLECRDRGARFHAAQLLGRIGPEANAAIPALIRVLKEPLGESYRDPARGAARALGLMGPSPKATAALIEVISPEQVESNLAAYQKVPPTLPATRDGPADLARLALVRGSMRIMSAIEGLGDIGPPAVAAVAALIAAYNRALDYHTMAQTAIPAALGRIAPNSAAAPDAVAILIRALDSKGNSFRLGAVEALGHFGTDAAAAIARLRALAEDSDRSIRDAAAKSLAAIEAGSKPGTQEEQGRRRRP